MKKVKNKFKKKKPTLTPHPIKEPMDRPGPESDDDITPEVGEVTFGETTEKVEE